MIKLTISKYNENLKEHSYELLRSCLSNSFKEKFDRLKDLKQKQFVAMEYLILKILLNKKNNFDFSFNKYGKPFIENSLNFNISHSGDYLAVAVSNNEIGIDLQKNKTVKESILKRICSEKEMMYIDDSGDKNFEFTKIWTKKEAFVKRYGQSIIQNLSKIDTFDNKRKYMTFQFKDYVLTLCLK